MSQPTIQKTLGQQGVKWTNVPEWVDLDSAALDQFYTKPEMAQYCFSLLHRFLHKRDIALNQCFFIEPSAGTGAFLDVLPSNSRYIALDIDPKDIRVQKQDYITWDRNMPSNSDDTIIVFGNPPFGFRSWLALAFMNKSAEYADYIAFILPMAFISEGKGTPKYRVKGMRLVESWELDADSFITDNNSKSKLKTVFQIWEKGENRKPDWKNIEKLFDVKVVQNTAGRKCNWELRNTSDILIPQAFYDSENGKTRRYWDDSLYGTAYAVSAKNRSMVDDMVAWLESADWYGQYSSAATHGCRHVNKFFIYQRLSEKFSGED